MWCVYAVVRSGGDVLKRELQITRGIHTDCLLNYETVKYFCGEEHEAQRYREAIEAYQSLEYRVISAYIGLWVSWMCADGPDSVSEPPQSCTKPDYRAQLRCFISCDDTDGVFV